MSNAWVVYHSSEGAFVTEGDGGDILLHGNSDVLAEVVREHNTHAGLVAAVRHFLELETPDGNTHVERIRRDLLRRAPEFAGYLLEARAALEAAKGQA